MSQQLLTTEPTLNSDVQQRKRRFTWPPPEGDFQLSFGEDASIMYTEHLLICHEPFRFKCDLNIKDKVIVLRETVY